VAEAGAAAAVAVGPGVVELLLFGLAAAGAGLVVAANTVTVPCMNGWIEQKYA
jgi:hypothetical protein